MDTLKIWRDQLDQLDQQIVSLLNKRMQAVEEIGKIKQSNHLTVLDTGREQEVLKRVERFAEHAVLKANMAPIYQAIMTASKQAQQLRQSSASPFKRIGIVGLGLMGGSICKAIKAQDPSIELSTLACTSEDCALAVSEGWISKEYTSLADLMRNSQLLILATPISTVVPLAEEISLLKAHMQPLIVMDIASVKRDIVLKFENLSNGSIEYVGTHPIAGSEKRGFAHSQANLFLDATWAIVPHTRNRASTLDSIAEFVRFLGACPMSLAAVLHDQQAALISHLPGILSRTFYQFVQCLDGNSIKMAGPGFKSFTRLAHSNGEMRREIESYNKQIIIDYLLIWIEYLKARL